MRLALANNCIDLLPIPRDLFMTEWTFIFYFANHLF